MSAGAFEAALDRVAGQLQMSLMPEARAKVLAHYRLLEIWNRKVALTTIRDPAEIAQRHFGEALFLARELPAGVRTVLDVGSGAGFPGLPLAAVEPGVVCTLLEAVQRKAVFLREVSRAWSNVTVRNERLETLDGSWDACVMRAVAVAGTLRHLARLCGSAYLLLGEEAAAEAREGGLFAWQPPIPLPWGERRLLLKGERST